MGRRVMKRLLLLTAGLVLLFTGCDDLTKELEEAILASNGLQEYALTLVAGTGGSVSPDTEVMLKSNDPITISATPESGSYAFQYWEQTAGDGSVKLADENSATTTASLLDGDVTIKANFALNPRNLTITTDTGCTLTTPSSSPAVVSDGQDFSISVTPWTGYTFDGWTITSGSSVTFGNASLASTTVSLSGGDATINANMSGNPTGSISIQNKIFLSGDYYSTNRTVTVHYSYTDIPGNVEMKVSESSFSTGTTTGWTDAGLSGTYTFSTDGDKTLYVRFRDEGGNESPIYSDTVTIDSTAPRFTKYEVDRVTYPYSDGALYVTSASSADLSLDYLATDDAGVGVDKVYFANSPYARPSTAQVDPYTNPPALYPWSLRYTTTRGYYYVRFWVEDLLGNISNAYEREVRYDDKYERSGGNNTIDSLSGATKVVNNSSDYQDDLYGGYGEYAYLVDTDFYKWGFYGYESANGSFMNPFSTFYADFVIYINEAGDWEGDFDIDFFDHNWDPIATTAPVYNYSARTLTFDQQVIMPYINTNGYEYYFYMRIRRNGASPPYSPRNYNISWDFWEDEGM